MSRPVINQMVRAASGERVPAVELRRVPLVQYRCETPDEACKREIDNITSILRGPHIERLRREAQAIIKDYIVSGQMARDLGVAE